MKKITFLFVMGFLALSFKSFSQIKVSSTGDVGINNTSPAYQLDVSGDLRVKDGSNEFFFTSGEFYPATSSFIKLGRLNNEWYELHATNAYFQQYTVYSSDEHMKTDIKGLSSSKGKIKELRPVKYKFKSGLTEHDPGEQIGLIAQEVQPVFPEIVVTKNNGELGIRYTALIPVLIKAMQEQQDEIDDLKARIDKLESSKKQP